MFKKKYFDYIKDVENLMDRRLQARLKTNRFSQWLMNLPALRISMDKKEINEINDSFEKELF